MYWWEACSMHSDQEERGGTWKDGAFTSIFKEYKNCLISCEHSVGTKDCFHAYLCRGIEKPDEIIPQDLKAGFEVLFKLYDVLKADNAPTIEEERHSSSSIHCLLNIIFL